MAYAWGATSNSANAASGTSLTLSITLSASDRVVGWCTYGSGATVTETFSDGTNTWTKLFTLNDATNSQSVAVFECKSAAAGSYTLTFSLASAQLYRGMAIARITGVDNSAASVTNKTNNVGPGTGANAVTSGTLTPSAANGGLIGICMDDSATETSITAGTGFTDRSNMANVDTAIGVKSRVEDKSVTTTSAQAATFTAGSGTGRFLTIAYAIQDAGGGGGGITVKNLAALGVG